jgi:phospholipid/cholesterol/gamma-HCH transport system substrate-binding protein
METRSAKLDILLGAMVIGVAVLFVWLSLAVGGGAPRDAQRYVLLFDSALGLHQDNTVAIAGVHVGVVADIGIEGRRARVTIAIDPSVTLHENARAAVRAKTLLGEKYVDLDPGEAPAPVLTAGAVLEDNAPTVEIDGVIRSVSQLVQSLNVITPPLETAVARVDALLKDADNEKLSEELTRTLADAGVLIRDTSKLVSSSSDDVQVLLKLMRDKGPGIFEELESASSRLDRLLAAFDQESITKGTEKIGPTLDNVEVAVKDMRLAMADIKSASGHIESILVKLDRNLSRVEDINERSIRELLQVEGLRVNLIPDARVERRVKHLRNEATPLPGP